MLTLAARSFRSINRFFPSISRLRSKCLTARLHGGYFPVVQQPPETLKLDYERYPSGVKTYGLVDGVPVTHEDIDYIPTCLRYSDDENYLRESERRYGPTVMRYFREHLNELPSEQFKGVFEKLTRYPGGVGRRGAEKIIGLDGGLRLKFFNEVVQEIIEYDDVWHCESCQEDYNLEMINWVLTGLDSVVSRARNELKEAETPLFDKDGRCLVSVKDFAGVVFFTTKWSSWGYIRHRTTRDTAIYQLGELYRDGLQRWKKAEAGIVIGESVCKLPSRKSYETYRFEPPLGAMNYEEWFWDIIFKQGVPDGVNIANGAVEKRVGLEGADWTTFKEANTGPWARELDRRIAIDKDIIEDTASVPNFSGESRDWRPFQAGYSAANSKDF